MDLEVPDILEVPLAFFHEALGSIVFSITRKFICLENIQDNILSNKF